METKASRQRGWPGAEQWASRRMPSAGRLIRRGHWTRRAGRLHPSPPGGARPPAPVRGRRSSPIRAPVLSFALCVRVCVCTQLAIFSFPLCPRERKSERTRKKIFRKNKNKIKRDRHQRYGCPINALPGAIRAHRAQSKRARYSAAC